MVKVKVAIVGGGPAGTAFAHQLAKLLAKETKTVGEVQIDLLDQGRGLGGRSSHRFAKEEDGEYEFDHGCQFFRADTQIMRTVVDELVQRGSVVEWKGNFVEAEAEIEGSKQERADFFGMPHQGPYYVGVNGMHSVPHSLASMAKEEGEKNGAASVNIFPATRVSKLIQAPNKKWRLEGVGGKAALHDTKESEAKMAQHSELKTGSDSGDAETWDFVVLTDLSSTSFDSWHRASAGVPDSFAAAVRKKVGARVPLFTAMVALEKTGTGRLLGGIDTLTFPLSAVRAEGSQSQPEEPLWFAARNNSKEGLGHLTTECWTLVSTPRYATGQIREVPMQDEETGEFLPQEPEYLKDTIASELIASFLKTVRRQKAAEDEGEVKVKYRHAQRWGSALPAPRHLATDLDSPSRLYLSGVAYDTGMCPLAPTTTMEMGECFHYDDSLQLMQVGDMVCSSTTPGLESAVVSAVRGAEHIMGLLRKEGEKESTL